MQRGRPRWLPRIKRSKLDSLPLRPTRHDDLSKLAHLSMSGKHHPNAQSRFWVCARLLPINGFNPMIAKDSMNALSPMHSLSIGFVRKGLRGRLYVALEIYF